MPTLQNINKIIAVSSCKGGVGKSTVAAYLALNLSARGFKVGLLDADIYGPSVPTLFSMANQKIFTNEQQQLLPAKFQDLKIMSFGFLLGDGPAVMRGPIVTRYLQQLFQQTAWGELDYLIVDMPPGTGDVQLTITQTVQLSGALIVTTPQTLSLVDVQRGILMFEKVKVPILGIIENMSYFLCDQCQTKHAVFGKSNTALLEKRFGLQCLAELPILPELSQPVDQFAQSPVIKEAVDRILKVLQQGRDHQNVPKVTADKTHIHLKWADGRQLDLPNRELRLNCACALCLDEMSGKKLMDEKKIPDTIAPVEIVPLGNYAVGIKWSDGHASGIYPYQMIEAIAKKLVS